MVIAVDLGRKATKQTNTGYANLGVSRRHYISFLIRAKMAFACPNMLYVMVIFG